MPQDSSDCPQLPVLPNGCISKSDLRETCFNGSRSHYLQTIELMCECNKEFAKKYERYVKKKLIPKELVIDILTHIEWILNDDYKIIRV